MIQEARLYNTTHLVYKAIRQITARYDPQNLLITNVQGHLLKEPEEAKQRWRQYFFDTLFNDPNAVNVDYNKKYLGSHLNTRDDGEILNIDRNEAEEAIKIAKCKKTSGVDDTTSEELKMAT